MKKAVTRTELSERLNAQSLNPSHRRFSPETEAIIHAILQDDEYVLQTVRALFGRQTPKEQAVQKTVVRNGVGLAAPDARRFSQMIERLDQNGGLSQEDYHWCRRPTRQGIPYLARYRRQLGQLLPPPNSLGPDDSPARKAPTTASTSPSEIELNAA